MTLASAEPFFIWYYKTKSSGLWDSLKVRHGKNECEHKERDSRAFCSFQGKSDVYARLYSES